MKQYKVLRIIQCIAIIHFNDMQVHWFFLQKIGPASARPAGLGATALPHIFFNDNNSNFANNNTYLSQSLFMQNTTL